MLDRPLSGAVCERCWSAIARFPPPAAAIGEYDGVLREIIHALKYQGRRSTAPRLSALMAEQAFNVLDGADAVVPVPLHAQRERQRGFNQADDLARGLGLPVIPLLRRVRSTQPQVDLAAAERRRNVMSAFEFVTGRSEDRPAQVIVLVDDVVTTGATLEACARVLKQAGAREVRALTAARVSSAPR
jgi:ComF family protein